jgi:hypothetical protein
VARTRDPDERSGVGQSRDQRRGSREVDGEILLASRASGASPPGPEGSAYSRTLPAAPGLRPLCASLQRSRTLTIITVPLLASVSGAQASSPSLTVVASGLENPRGLEFGPGGQLYVAEGGLGGTTTTTPAQCTQVPAPVGPYSGGFTARISRVGVDTGVRETVAAGLPSSVTSPAAGGFISGIADVKFADGALYALIAGAGCSHGLAGTVNSIVKVERGGRVSQVADLSSFLMTHPVANPNPGDFEPDGTWYSMVRNNDTLYPVEPNHGEVDIVSKSGSISRLLDVSATQGHVVPTSITRHGDNFYLGNLGIFDPGAEGKAGVYRISRLTGAIQSFTPGLTAVTGVAWHGGHLYALEAFTGFFAPAPFVASTGTVARLGEDGKWTPIVTGLNFPTAMVFRGDDLYVSDKGFGFGPTDGQIVRVHIDND